MLQTDIKSFTEIIGKSINEARDNYDTSDTSSHQYHLKESITQLRSLARTVSEDSAAKEDLSIGDLSPAIENYCSKVFKGTRRRDYFEVFRCIDVLIQSRKQLAEDFSKLYVEEENRSQTAFKETIAVNGKAEHLPRDVSSRCSVSTYTYPFRSAGCQGKYHDIQWLSKRYEGGMEAARLKIADRKSDCSSLQLLYIELQLEMERHINFLLECHQSVFKWYSVFPEYSMKIEDGRYKGCELISKMCNEAAQELQGITDTMKPLDRDVGSEETFIAFYSNRASVDQFRARLQSVLIDLDQMYVKFLLQQVQSRVKTYVDKSIETSKEANNEVVGSNAWQIKSMQKQVEEARSKLEVVEKERLAKEGHNEQQSRLSSREFDRKDDHEGRRAHLEEIYKLAKEECKRVMDLQFKHEEKEWKRLNEEVEESSKRARLE